MEKNGEYATVDYILSGKNTLSNTATDIFDDSWSNGYKKITLIVGSNNAHCTITIQLEGDVSYYRKKYNIPSNLVAAVNGYRTTNCELKDGDVVSFTDQKNLFFNKKPQIRTIDDEWD